MIRDDLANYKEATEVPNKNFVKKTRLESLIFIIIFFTIFGLIAKTMGAVNMLNTIMNTAYRLLIDVCLYIMAIAVMAGALSGILSEFGIIDLMNKLLSILIKPIYDLPGAASLGVITCYFSDNPAILTLAKDSNFNSYFKKYQLPALTNLGTSFGMGLLITTAMMAVGIDGAVRSAIIGNLGAIIGSIVSVRMMLSFTKKYYGDEAGKQFINNTSDEISYKKDNKSISNVGTRVMDSLLLGGKSGVDLGLSIIPGVLVICTIVTILTNGTSELTGTFTGGAYEGISVLPFIGEKLSFIFKPIFGFTSPESIAVPITALGSAGAAVGLIPDMVNKGLVSANDISVFTAMCMCWSGYLSTHIAMMDSLDCVDLTGKAIISHTIGGVVAGISANILFKIFEIII